MEITPQDLADYVMCIPQPKALTEACAAEMWRRSQERQERIE